MIITSFLKSPMRVSENLYWDFLNPLLVFLQISLSPLGAISNIVGSVYDKLRYERLQKGISDFEKFSGRISDKILQLEEFKDVFYMVLNNYGEAPSSKVREIASRLNQSLFEKISENVDDPTPQSIILYYLVCC